MKPVKSTRAPFTLRRFIVFDTAIRDRAIAAIGHMPVDPLRPLEVLVRENKEKRHDMQNRYYWQRLNEISAQAWIDGRQFAAETLHEYFKRELLPNDGQADPADVRDGYVKWQFDPAGERVLVGSTTMLTVRGFAAYTEAVEAFGASLGVEFSANPMDGHA
jgi:hypothetical protein